MARFLSQGDREERTINVSGKNYPFKNIYGVCEEQFIYVNMQAIENLKSTMVCLRDIAVIADISGSMRPYYNNGEMQNMITQIVDSLAWADDDGIDVYFFANGLVYNDNVANANDVEKVIKNAIVNPKAFKSTMPTECFKVFCEQIKRKNRAGTVLFLTDGVMDDLGQELVSFYKNILHNEFKTRDNFYCYSIAFGKSASKALDVLNGLYSPEGGPEDLFDLEQADNLLHITEILSQVGGMSAIGSNNVYMKATVDNGIIDVVNQDLIEGGRKIVEGPINETMSFRINSKQPFVFRISVHGYDDMVIRVTPDGNDVKIEML